MPELFYIYVLESLSSNKRYVGMTIDINRRLKEHNAGKSKFTNAFKPWKIIYSETANSRKSARGREKYLKSAAGRRFLKNIFSLND
ncbi:MAG: GIY-YIG nuclease family protein [Bacteroidetes bacterium]|nr:GIY-YIG nuclease family protein [Bacteroidota bacterium]MCK4288641.1 GIY-YIG nuclease family protein [Bacteroidales bacterium]MCK4361303.1 GIY-YIG nuclease family protein [Bacteroidales bacterium]